MDRIDLICSQFFRQLQQNNCRDFLRKTNKSPIFLQYFSKYKNKSSTYLIEHSIVYIKISFGRNENVSRLNEVNIKQKWNIYLVSEQLISKG